MRSLVGKTDLKPDTGDVLVHLFESPPLPESRQIPASEETGIRIGLVAGAGYQPATWSDRPDPSRSRAGRE